MKRRVVGVLLGALVCLVLPIPVGAWPLTSSQTITTEHGPDGIWLSQAWVIEWQARPEWRAAVIYDAWRLSTAGAGWTAPTKQLDMSATWEGERWGRPLALTAGRRRCLHAGGPAWTYGTVMLGW